MNSEKLVDAIGLLDDELITSARSPKIKKFPIAIKILAACLAVLLVPVIAVFGVGHFLGNLGADAADPVYRYAFTQEALQGICNQNICATTTLKDGYYASVGANPPEIVYADDEKAIFITYEGIYVYKFKDMELFTSFSLEKIGVPSFGQGDKTTYISISKDGNSALLVSSENISSIDREVEYRILNMKNGDIDLLDKTEVEDFDAFVTEENFYAFSENSIVDTGDFVSTRMVTFENSHIFIRVEYGEETELLIGFAELVVVENESEVSTFRVFESVDSSFGK